MLGALPFFTATIVDSAAHLFGSTDRRLRAVERNPQMASSHDIEMLVRAHGTPESQVWTVVDRMETAELSPAQIWAWTIHNDGIALAELLASSVTDDELVDLFGRRVDFTGVRAA